MSPLLFLERTITITISEQLKENAGCIHVKKKKIQIGSLQNMPEINRNAKI